VQSEIFRFSVSLAIQIMLRTVSCAFGGKRFAGQTNRFSLHLLTNSHSCSVYDLRQYCYPAMQFCAKIISGILQ